MSSDDKTKPPATPAPQSNPPAWQPPPPVDDRHNVRDERAPWGRWSVGALALGLILFGAIWLVTKVILPAEIPNRAAEAPRAEQVETPKIKKSDDDEAWVRALEKDTLAGYREYLALFPQGAHQDAAQKEIDAYDNKAWDIAEQRATIAGYEDYLEAWPEGLHASKAQERIDEMKARADAIAKDAAERAARESADWEKAARTNTVDSYGQYLTAHPAGPNAKEAQSRIDRLKASAADVAAWTQAKSANRAEAYQQYLTSFPQGAYVAEAIAAIEQLKPAPGRTFKDCEQCPLMVSLPPGTANLGAGENEAEARPNEKPQRPVTFTDMFAIGVTEVTFTEWQACVASGGCAKTPSNNGWGGGSRPVINVSWDDAQKYAAWLSKKTGLSYSLPSEAQWEYAARAGDSGKLAGGSGAALCAFANGAAQESGLKWANSACTDPAADRTLPAGMLGANAFGAKDMIGNVAEWTLDCNTLNLRDAPTDGKADQRGSCNQRVVRGGSWFSGPSDLRFAARLMQRRGDSNDFTGFRVVRKIEK